MEIIKEGGEEIYLIEGWGLDASNVAKVVKFGMLKADLKKKTVDRGLLSVLGQFYGLVVPGLILTRHIFQGLERPLYCDGNMNGDTTKYAHSRRPKFDCEWEGAEYGGDLAIKKPPEKSVFVVIISGCDKHKEQFPSVSGWIERWNWVDEDAYLSEAPLNWVDRYGKRIYTREDA